MRIRCPHCRNPIDVTNDNSLVEVNCPSCGSSFSLTGGDTTETYRTESRRIAHFELVRELGIGKFGSVWLAKDTQLDRTVAIKIPRKGALDAEETTLFLRDARAQAQLKHPGIVSVHEVGREKNILYIVSDYIAGANLKEWLSGQKLTFREAADLIVKVADALHHAHESGVVHRDLKPGNIMLDQDGEPHVIDFGLAKRDAGEITMTMDGHILGTPAYMSPEQAKGKGHDADRRSDVYSLGVILYELLTGELPFRGTTQMLLWQIQYEEPPRPRKLNGRVPRDLETIALKCLEKEPGKRYHTAEALSDDLQRWRAGRPIAARPVGRIERGWRWGRANRLVATLGAIALLLLISGTAVSTFFAIRANAMAKNSLIQQRRAETWLKEAQKNEQSLSWDDPSNPGRLDRIKAEVRAINEATALVPLYEASILVNPNDLNARAALAKIRLRLGKLHTERDVNGASENFVHGIDQLTYLVAIAPSDFDSCLSLAEAYAALSRLQLSIGLQQLAIASCDNAVKHMNVVNHHALKGPQMARRMQVQAQLVETLAAVGAWRSFATEFEAFIAELSSRDRSGKLFVHGQARLALAKFAIGDITGYRAIRKDLLAKYDQPDLNASEVCLACILEDIVDEEARSKLVEMSKRCLAGFNKVDPMVIQGAVLYRAGKHTDAWEMLSAAVRRLDEPYFEGDRVASQLISHLFLARFLSFRKGPKEHVKQSALLLEALTRQNHSIKNSSLRWDQWHSYFAVQLASHELGKCDGPEPTLDSPTVINPR